MVEAAIAIPVAVLLFAGCIQLLQIGLAHIVVLDAAYEAGRRAALDDSQTDNAARLAADICRVVSPGATEFRQENGAYTVTHHLRSIFPLVKNITVTQRCPQTSFDVRRGSEP